MKSTMNPLNTGMTMLTRSWIRLMKKVFLTFLRHPVKVTKATDTERGVIIASDYAKILTRDSNILQKIFQVLQLNRLDYPDVTKKSLN